jgi:hypothetical protein
MKNLFFYLLGAALLTFTACDKDDCNSDDLDTNIVGEWNVQLAGITVGQVEFHANGDIEDVSGVLIDDQIGGITVTSKTYTVPDNSTITLTGANATTSIDTHVSVNSFDCDEIDVTYQGTDLKLRRVE